MNVKTGAEWGMGPGMFQGVPAEKYHGLKEVDGVPVVSQTVASAMKDCPARARFAIEEGLEATAGMKFGTIFHAALLEPMEYAMNFAVAGQCVAKTQSGSRCSKGGSVRRGGGWYCGTPGHAPEMEDDPITVVSRTEEAKIDGMRSFLRTYAPARAIFDQPGGFEISMLWKHEGSGLWVRNRFDFLSVAARIGVDAKKTADASRSGFEKSVATYGYHRQAWLYDQGAKSLGVDDLDFLFLAQEDRAPFIAAARRLRDGAYDLARREMEEGYVDGNGDYVRKGLLYRLAECFEKDEWPGYEEMIGDVGVSSWYERELINAETEAV